MAVAKFRTGSPMAMISRSVKPSFASSICRPVACVAVYFVAAPRRRASSVSREISSTFLPRMAARSTFACSKSPMVCAPSRMTDQARRRTIRAAPTPAANLAMPPVNAPMEVPALPDCPRSSARREFVSCSCLFTRSHSAVPGAMFASCARSCFARFVSSAMVMLFTDIWRRSASISALFCLTVAVSALIAADSSLYRAVSVCPCFASISCSLRIWRMDAVDASTAFSRSRIFLRPESPFTMTFSRRSSSRITFPIEP